MKPGIRLFALLTAALLLVTCLSACGRDDGGDVSPSENITPPSAPSPDPSPSDTPSPDPSPSPSEEPSPEPSPSPSPEPSPEPSPAFATGSFLSDTGSALNLYVSWHASDNGDGSAALTVEVGIITYSLQFGSLPNGGTLTIGGSSKSFTTESIDYDGDEQTAIPLFTHTVDVSLNGGSADVEISASWLFKGSYGGIEIETITAEGSAHLEP